jgi:cytochrome c oxidase cbb3-type subunit I/II
MSTEQNAPQESFHRRVLEHRSAAFAVLTTVTMLIGGMVEIIPMFSASAGPDTLDNVTPYTPLELAGRDIYLREGCYNCHSQMVRPFRAETLRYGPWSRAGEYAYDHPFQLGSRRIGPDLHRVGGKYPDAWHFEHMKDPRATSPGSVMPSYPWLIDDKVDPADIQASVRAMKTIGVPYTDEDITNVPASLAAQQATIVSSLASAKITVEGDREIVALIGYLQRLGKDGRAAVAAGGAP